MTTVELFKAFGGREVVMAITGQSRNAVNHWFLAGVPFRHWPALVEAATNLDIPGVTLATLQGTRPKASRRRRRRCAAE
jgi:hypothetical protein